MELSIKNKLRNKAEAKNFKSYRTNSWQQHPKPFYLPNFQLVNAMDIYYSWLEKKHEFENEKKIFLSLLGSLLDLVSGLPPINKRPATVCPYCPRDPNVVLCVFKENLKDDHSSESCVTPTQIK